MRALLQNGLAPSVPGVAGSSIPIVSLLPTGGVDSLTSPIVVTNSGSKGGGGGFSLGPVAYISGICLLVAVAVCLLLVACLLRRKDRRHAAAAATQHQAQLAAAAAAAAQEAAYRAAHPPTLPVVIVNPDGEFELAEKIEVCAYTPKGGLDGAALPAGGGNTKGGEPPIGFSPSRT